ncbi:hypothetical protein SBRCBS47491_008720 [Sporothrix bragantina]|uniref:Major facilitator superfamily (MFS) profile domain-containing protein n=1 Tax=Sporothrix bragantina TaxID=671064 RepID=A0ABP0CRC7_9PEZI
MSTRNVYQSAGIASSTAWMFGYGTGYIGGILVLPSFSHHFHLHPHDRAGVQSLIISIWLLGAFFGVLCAQPVCARLGRRRCLVVCAAIYTAGVVFQLLSVTEPESSVTVNLIIFELGRLLSGAGVGVGTLVAPLYITEISLPWQRGMLHASWQVAMQIAALVGFWGTYVSNGLFPDTSDWQWTVPVLLQVLPGIILLVGGIALLPESPIWLAEQQQVETAIKTHAWLHHGDNHDITAATYSSPDATSQEEVVFYRSISDRKQHATSSKQQNHLRALFRPLVRKRLVRGIVLMALMTLSGTNALNFFAPVIFMSAGFTATGASLLLTGLFGLVKLAAALSFMLYFVRVRGHRFWISVSAAACAASLLVLAFCVKTFEHRSGKVEPASITYGATACLMVFVFAFFFGIGHGPIAWSFCAEVFPADVSTLCCTVTTCSQWLFQTVNAVATPFLLAGAGWRTWLLFSAVNAITLGWCYVYLPETRGVALGRAMDEVFKDELGGLSSRVAAKAGRVVVVVQDEERAIPTEETSLLAEDRSER